MEKTLYLLKCGRLYGFIDQNGKIVIDPIYIRAKDFSEDLALVTTINGEKKFINEKNEEVIAANFDSISSFSNGFAFFKSQGKSGYINKSGKVAIPSQFDWVIHNFNDSGLSIVEVDGRYGAINKFGSTKIDFIYESMGNFFEGLASTTIANKHGYIDIDGNLIIDYNYSRAACFSEGLAAVDTSKGWAYINKSGDTVIKPVFDIADNFKNGLALIIYKGEWGYINRSGEFVYKPKGFELW